MCPGEHLSLLGDFHPVNLEIEEGQRGTWLFLNLEDK